MDFLAGLELNERFYRDVVSPILAAQYPGLRYSAALIGYGSDVLGFDTPISMDHNWGPRLQVFLSGKDVQAIGSRLAEQLKQTLPLAYEGYSTSFCKPRYDGTQSMEQTDSHPVNHLIEIDTVDSYFSRYLGVDVSSLRSPLAWLELDDQKLLEVTSGKVFHDGLGSLVDLRKRLSFFPHDVLLFRLARLWRSVEEDEPLIGRSIELGNPIATKILAARLVETCVKICMYLEGRYLPYAKWLIRSFETTGVYHEVSRVCVRALAESDLRSIEDRLCALYEKVVQVHNRHTELPGFENRIRYFFGRPYKVIFAESIVKVLKEAISIPEIAERV